MCYYHKDLGRSYHVNGESDATCFSEIRDFLTDKAANTIRQKANALGFHDNVSITLYKPKLREGEHNIMLEAVQEYLPREINGGWIPYDMEERKRIYSKTFEELKKYMNVIIRQQEEEEEWKRKIARDNPDET